MCLLQLADVIKATMHPVSPLSNIPAHALLAHLLRTASTGDRMRFKAKVVAGAVEKLAAIVNKTTMAKFAAEGFTFVGHAPLSAAPRRAKVLAVFRAAKEAAASRFATAGLHQSGSGASAFDGIVSYSSPVGSNPSSQLLRVEIMRGDPSGNVFYKS
jgi:hypothetical protein